MEENMLNDVAGSMDSGGEGPPYSLPGVLQFVQHEWARFERERSKWEVERAELQTKLAFLQGERRGQENLKFDLVRRIKMLEYALRQERLKYHQLKYGTMPMPVCGGDDINSTSESASAAVNTGTTRLRPGRELLRQYLQEVNVTDGLLEVRDVCRNRVLNASSVSNHFGSTDTMQSRGSMSTRSNSCSFSSSDNNLTSMLSRGGTSSPPPGTERPPGMVDFTSDLQPAHSAAAAVRTSPTATSSFPQAPPSGATDMIETVRGDIPASQAATEAIGGSAGEAKYPGEEDAEDAEESRAKEEERFSAALSQDPPTWIGSATQFSPDKKTEAAPKSPRTLPTDDPTEALSKLGLLPASLSGKDEITTPLQSADGACMSRDRQQQTEERQSAESSKRPVAKRISRTDAAAMAGQLTGFADDLAPGQLPGGASSPTGTLTERDVNKLTETSRHTPPGVSINEPLNVTDLVSLSKSSESAEDHAAIEEAKKVWAPKFSLHSHYDSVRSVAFHPNELVMMTASEDATVKLWNLEKAPSGKRNGLPDLEPIHTYRGHRGPVLSTAFSPNGQFCFSGGKDGRLCRWKTFTAECELYQEYDYTQESFTALPGHTDCVWDLSVHSVLPLIASASADGNCCIWDYSLGEAANSGSASAKPIQTLTAPKIGLSDKVNAPTSVDFVHNEPGQALAGYQSGKALLYDYNVGKVVCSFTGIGSAQINQVACHPTLSFSIAGLDDRRIVYLDHRTGQVMFSMLAHLDSVSCLSIDPSGLYLLSGSHDCSLRLWTIESRACIQEMTAHRKKLDESVFSVAFHPSKGYLASGGADSVAKVFA